MDITLRKPRKADTEELDSFFEIVIADTFEKEGIGHMCEAIDTEVGSKKRLLAEYFETGQEHFCFFVACHGHKIVGTIAYCRCNELISQFSDGELDRVGEINTVFVLPDYQQKGIGNLLLNSVYIYLISNSISEFCIDSGYVRAQRIWTKKYGEPRYKIQNFWGEGFHHMVWHCRTEDIPVCYRSQ